MNTRTASLRTVASLISCLFCFVANSPELASQVPATAVAAYDAYANQVESTLARQHRSPAVFLAASPETLGGGDPVLEQITPSGGNSLPGALIHHWRGTEFIPGATAAQFERLLKDYKAYPQNFAPQVLRASVLGIRDDHLQVTMRVSQRHVIAVVMDSTYDVVFGRLDAQHGYSQSKSTAISEIGSAGTRNEHALSAADEHGFLWRQNTYWSYEGRDGGLAVQVESISLTRAIPAGLGWAVRPFVESVPRDSLDFTLRCVSKALRK